MRILAIGITFCLVFYTVCVSDQNDYNADDLMTLDSDLLEELLRSLTLDSDQSDYDAGIAAYKRGHYSVAFSNFESRAMEDDPVAQFCLGFMYKHGKGVAVDEKKAIEWYRRAAFQDYAPAQNNLGVMYVRKYESAGNRYSETRAVEWFRKAADQGYLPAQFNLGIITEHKSAVFALEWYTKAAKQGYLPAQDHLGALYYHGDSVEQNPISAVKWFRVAAEQGYPSAQHNLGICYKKGFGVDRNLEEAFRWWKKAAEQGDTNGQFSTALSYMIGEGVDKDPEEAFRWYKKAAEQNHVSAQNNLAKMYRDFAVQYKKEKDEKRSKYCAEMANRWYLRAAQLGSGIAQRNIGRNFEKGENEDGVSPDPIEAYYWYSLALKNKTDLEKSDIKNPVSEVREARYRIEKSLKKENEELINQIQQQVDNWKPKQLVARGTGFYVDENHILTNAHVVVWEEKPGSNRLYAYDEFCIPYRRVTLKDINKDINLEFDLALLYDEHRKIDESGNAFANFRLKDIEVGEKIVSFGYPQGNRLSFKGNLTDGVVSGLSYPITSPRPEIGFQHTAPAQRGNSGGPVFDTSGDVVGISVMILADHVYLSEGIGAYHPETINLAQNMNFAIRSDVIKDFLLKHYILGPKAVADAFALLEKAEKGVLISEEDLYKAITLQEIHAKADKITVPVLCFKSKKQDPVSVEEIGIDGLKE